jgi:hypothetical protein
MRHWAAVTALLIALAPAGGCGGALADTDRRVRLPAGVPADLPLPAGAVLRTARDFGPRGLNLVFETEETLPAAAARMRERLESGGWELLSEATLDKSVFSSYRHGERSAAVGVSRWGSGTLVSISYVARPYSEWEGERG